MHMKEIRSFPSPSGRRCRPQAAEEGEGNDFASQIPFCHQTVAFSLSWRCGATLPRWGKERGAHCFPVQLCENDSRICCRIYKKIPFSSGLHTPPNVWAGYDFGWDASIGEPAGSALAAVKESRLRLRCYLRYYCSRRPKRCHSRSRRSYRCRS